MTYRYIYKITCTTGSFKDKFYFGQHTTDNLDDNYNGSGRKIHDYYKKHPNDFVKEIISFHDTQDELNEAEYNIIHPWLNHPMCLNLCDGGHTGTHSEEMRKKISESNKGKTKSEEHRKHIGEASKGRKPWNKGIKTGPLSEELKRKLSEVHKGHIAWNKGKHHTEEHRRKLSEALKGHRSWSKEKHLSEEHKRKISESEKGIKRGPFSDEHKRKLSEAHKGKPSHRKGIKMAWITLDNTHKLIKKDDLQKYLNAGWHKGRK